MHRRLDCVLADSKEPVLKRQAELKGKGLEGPDAQLRRASGFAFYNTSRYDVDELLADASHLAAKLRNYIAGFSPESGSVVVRPPQQFEEIGERVIAFLGRIRQHIVAGDELPPGVYREEPWQSFDPARSIPNPLATAKVQFTLPT